MTDVKHRIGKSRWNKNGLRLRPGSQRHCGGYSSVSASSQRAWSPSLDSLNTVFDSNIALLASFVAAIDDSLPICCFALQIQTTEQKYRAEYSLFIGE